MSKGLFKKNEIELGGDAEVTCVRKKARQVPEQRLSGILLETVPQDDRGVSPHLAPWTCHCICWRLQNILSVQLMHVKRVHKV